MAYCERQDVRDEGGSANVNAYADLNASGSNAEINAQIDKAIEDTAAEIDMLLIEAGRAAPATPPTPLSGYASQVTLLFKRINAKLALAYLYASRGQNDAPDTEADNDLSESPETVSAMKSKQRWAYNALALLSAPSSSLLALRDGAFTTPGYATPVFEEDLTIYLGL